MLFNIGTEHLHILVYPWESWTQFVQWLRTRHLPKCHAVVVASVTKSSSICDCTRQASCSHHLLVSFACVHAHWIAMPPNHRILFNSLPASFHFSCISCFTISCCSHQVSSIAFQLHITFQELVLVHFWWLAWFPCLRDSQESPPHHSLKPSILQHSRPLFFSLSSSSHPYIISADLTIYDLCHKWCLCCTSLGLLSEWQLKPRELNLGNWICTIRYRNQPLNGGIEKRQWEQMACGLACWLKAEREPELEL